jgi:FkbM family methyltransferase
MVTRELLFKSERSSLLGRLSAIKGYYFNQKSLASDRLALSFGEYILNFSGDSYSQFRQDLFVLFMLNDKKSGRFVEFGGADGVTHSNTLLLEKDYEWRGMIMEPTSSAFKELTLNRSSCALVHAAVSTESRGHVQMVLSGQISSIVGFHGNDGHAQKRIDAFDNGSVETVPVVDLSLLLQSHFDEGDIDYMSIDVEGAELAILKGFDFKLRPSLLTVEHNRRNIDLSEIEILMSAQGYVRIFEKCYFFTGPEAWFCRRDIFEQKLASFGIANT